jgi:hypothetical protein
MKAINQWFHTVLARRVPQTVGIYLVGCLVVLETSRLALQAAHSPTEWIGNLALGLLTAAPVVAVWVYLRRR